MADPVKDYTPEVPEQIKKQIAEAEAIRAQLDPNAGDPPPADEAAPPVTEPSPPPPEGQPAQPQEGFTQDGDEQTWEQRFRSQQGRLEQAQKSNTALAERLSQLESLLATMKVRGAEEERPAAAVPKVAPKLVTDKEAEEYGNEFLTVVGKRSREEFMPEIETMQQRLDRLEGRVEGVGTVMEKNRTQEVWGNLTAAVPQWRDINKHPQFIDWLGQPDPYSGQRRLDMLKEAFTRHETNRVVSFFRGFLTEAAGLPPNSQAKDPSAPPLPNGNGSGKPSLADFAAPGRARSAPQSLPPDKPVYTSAQIAKFMDDKRTGKYRGREADADAIERDIFQAQHEGRIH
jgi:hypothetical protein